MVKSEFRLAQSNVLYHIVFVNRAITIAFIFLIFTGELIAASYTVEGNFTFKASLDPTAPPPTFQVPQDLTGAARSNFEKEIASMLQKLTNGIPDVGTFELHFDDCAWSLTMVRNDEGTNSTTTHYKYDGTNLLYAVLPPPGSPPSTLGSGSVEPVAVPRAIDQMGPAVWLAFASECYFAQLTNGMAISIEPMDGRNGPSKRYEVPYRATFSHEAPYLPQEVVYTRINSQQLLSTGAVVTNALRAPFQNGYIKTRYEATSFTNVDGLVFPKSFTYELFFPQLKAKSEKDLFVANRVVGEVTKIVSGPSTIKDPLLDQTLYIQDKRLPEAYVLYAYSNALPATNSAVVIAARKRSASIIVDGVPPPPSGSGASPQY